MGRPPKSAEAKRLAGNPGKRALPDPKKLLGGGKATSSPPIPAVSAAASVFAPPSDLTPAERKLWSVELDRLRTAGLIRESDLSVFRTHIETLARKKRAKTVLDKQGDTYTTNSGYIRPRPEVAIVQQCDRLIVQILAKLAGTSDSRIRAQAQVANRQLTFPGMGQPSPASNAAAPSAHAGAESDDPVGYLN